jgi:hypothetical protein
MDPWGTPYDQIEAPIVIRTGRQFHPDPVGMLSQQGEQLQTKFLAQPTNLDRVQNLKSHGVYFLYGMLFEALFTIQELLLPDPRQVSDPTTHDTYFLHSRHPGNGLDGTYTWPEELCLHKFLDNRTITKPCTVYLMSDRQLAIDRLSTVISNLSCKVQSVTSRQAGTSFNKEHGPFAGAGYWQDLALAVHARTGFIAFAQEPRRYARSSTSLIREVVEFRRVLEGNSSTSIPTFQQCINPWRGV